MGSTRSTNNVILYVAYVIWFRSTGSKL